jgi:glycogen synthase
MRILMLSWEYPPRNIGGLSQHVFYLTQALENQGHEVYVITCKHENAAAIEINGNIHVHRVEPLEIEDDDFVKWVMQLNFAMLEECMKLIASNINFDIIHGHDWLVAYCAKVVKEVYKIPLVTTMHATEFGRNNGINTEIQRYIHSTEKYLAEISNKLIVCSNFMLSQVSEIFEIKNDKVKIIPNGVEQVSCSKTDLYEFRKQYATVDEKIVFYIGRLVFEKGVQFLIKAIPKILETNYKTKFVIAGTGPMADELKHITKKLELEDKVLFTEYIEEENKNMLYRAADVSVFPSLYEPFGIVALEAMEAGCPVVVSDVGGLAEIVEDGITGIKAIPGSDQSIADNIIKVLSNDELKTNLSRNARKLIEEEYSWEKVARLTSLAYEECKINFS